MTTASHERPDLLRLDYMAVPRWLREHRRAAARAARPHAIATEIVRALVPPGGGRRSAAGGRPIPLDDYRTREPMPDDQWEPFIAAIREAKGW